MNALIISGSRNRQGRTARAAGAILDGLKGRSAGGEVVFLTEQKIERCRQCDSGGWGTCRTEGVCAIKDDDFAALVDKMRAADALVFATPVYFGDLSESMKALLDRVRRICRHDEGKKRLAGKPAVGLCMAGGGGGGAPSCTVSLEKTLSQSGLDVVDVVPIRRQNLDMKLDVLKLTGAWLSTGPTSQQK